MSLYLECGYTSLNHFGEELCGDKVEAVRKDGNTTLVLADGLGSGVKANILATLTSKILCTMVSEDADIEECIETVIQTLPVCRERGVAYATFSVVHVNDEGEGILFEFDNPEAVYYSGGKCRDFDRTEHNICGKKVFETRLTLKAGDIIVLFSDGVPNAGAGMLLNYGFMRPEIMEYLNKNVRPTASAKNVACQLAGACYDLYLEQPMDDTTVAAVRIRERQNVTVMVGPPVDKENDKFYVEKFMAAEGKKIVCGGTSAQIVARHLKKDIATGFDVVDKEVPPISAIEGVDLTTEGILTLKKVKALSDKYVSSSDLTSKTFKKEDGASKIAQMLFEEATDVTFYVGQSVNSAHTGSEIDTTVKLRLVEAIADNLIKSGKEVSILYD